MKKTEALNLLNKCKSSLLKTYPSLADDLQKYNGYLCGGVWVDSLLETKYKDLDIYFDSKGNAEGFYLNISKNAPLCKGNSNIHLGKFEIMRFVTYPTAMDCINDFDFSCTQIAWDGVTFYFGEHTLQDISDRYLRLLDIHAPLVPTLQRVIKYINKGFKPDEHTFGTICKYIKQNGVDNVPMKFEAYLDDAEPKNENIQGAQIDWNIMEAVQARAQILDAQRAPHIPAGNIFGQLFGWNGN